MCSILSTCFCWWYFGRKQKERERESLSSWILSNPLKWIWLCNRSFFSCQNLWIERKKRNPLHLFFSYSQKRRHTILESYYLGKNNNNNNNNNPKKISARCCLSAVVRPRWRLSKPSSSCSLFFFQQWPFWLKGAPVDVAAAVRRTDLWTLVSLRISLISQWPVWSGRFFLYSLRNALKHPKHLASIKV